VPFWWDISPSQCLYLHRTAQRIVRRTYIHVSSGIQTHHPKFIRAFDRTTTEEWRSSLCRPLYSGSGRGHGGLPICWRHWYSLKVKLSLCFNWAPRHEGVLGEWMYSSAHSLISALDGGEWSASCPGLFTPRERAPGTHWIGGWVGPKAVLEAVVKRSIPSPRRKANPRTPIVQAVAQRYTDWPITTLSPAFVACVT
jgi:hypothetical protein